MGDLSPKLEGRKVFDSGDVWQLYHSGGEYLFPFTSPLLGSIPYKLARIKKDFTKGKVLLHEPYFDHNQPVNPLEYPLDELLLINFLALGKGVEIHACGFIDQLRKGQLFVGQSGAGKSTMARLWQGQSGVTVLSDDRIILRQEGGRILDARHTLAGDAGFSAPGCVRLNSIYLLSKGGQNELIAQKKAEASGRLFACTFSPFYSKKAVQFILDFLEKMVDHIPYYEFKVLPGHKVVHFIQELP